MKFSLKGGAEIEVATPGEVKELLSADRQAWQSELARGVDWRDISAQGAKSGALWSLDANTPNNNKDDIGPNPGFVWCVTRLYVSGSGVIAGTDIFSVFTDEASATKLVASGMTRGKEWDVGVFVLHGGKTLALSGAATGAGTDIWVAGQAVQMPRQLLWQLLGK